MRIKNRPKDSTQKVSQSWMPPIQYRERKKLIEGKI